MRGMYIISSFSSWVPLY